MHIFWDRWLVKLYFTLLEAVQNSRFQKSIQTGKRKILLGIRLQVTLNWFSHLFYKLNEKLKLFKLRQPENVVDIMQDKTGIFHEIERYLQNWHCDDSTILKCYRTLTNDLIENGLIIEESGQIIGKIKIVILFHFGMNHKIWTFTIWILNFR